jgi:hypothetical protein
MKREMHPETSHAEAQDLEAQSIQGRLGSLRSRIWLMRSPSKSWQRLGKKYWSL